MFSTKKSFFGFKAFLWSRHSFPLLLVLLLVIFMNSSFVQADIQGENLQKEIPAEGTKVYFIQLTGGEATLIELENGEVMLVDTGSSFSEPELFHFLNEQGIYKLDYLLITNLQDEHFGNFKKIYTQLDPDHLYFPYYLQEYFEHLDFLSETNLHTLQRGDEFKIDEETVFECLHPTESLSLNPKDNSLVFRLLHGEQRFLFMSDVTCYVENELVDQFHLRSHILKVSDFGSRQGSCQPFLQEVDAHVSLIFYRPQHYLEPEVLERLQESWMDVYPLKNHGHVLIVSQKDNYELFVLSA